MDQAQNIVHSLYIGCCMTPYDINADNLQKSPNIQHESNKKDRSKKSLPNREIELPQSTVGMNLLAIMVVISQYKTHYNTNT